MKANMLFILLILPAMLIAQEELEVKLGLDVIPSEGLEYIYYTDIKGLRSVSHFETFMQCWDGNPWGASITERWYFEYIDDIDSLTRFSHLEKKKRKSLDSDSKGKIDEIQQLMGYSRKSLLITCRDAQIIFDDLIKKGSLVKTGVSVGEIPIYQMSLGKERRKAFLAKLNIDRILQSDTLNSLTNTIETMSGKEETIANSVEVYDLLDRMDMFGQVWIAEFKYWKDENIHTSIVDKSGGMATGNRINRTADKSRIDLDVRTLFFGEKITRKWILFTGGDNSKAVGIANYISPPPAEELRTAYFKIAQYELDNANVTEGKNYVSRNVVYTKEILDYMKEYRIKRKEKIDAEKKH